MNATMRGDGRVSNLVTNLQGIVHFVARIFVDERTLNRYVFAWGEELTEKEIYEMSGKIS
jgi:hypothetical protein